MNECLSKLSECSSTTFKYYPDCRWTACVKLSNDA